MQRVPESRWPEIPVSDLARVVAAVRGGTAVAVRARWPRHRSMVVFFASILIFLHAAFIGASPMSPTGLGPHEEIPMSGLSFAARSAVWFSAAVAPFAPLAVLSAPGIASAQEAVEWRVADGGNGHWYGALRVGEVSSWNDAYAKAVSRGAYLATISSTAESEFIWARIASNPNYWSFQSNFSGPALGGYYSAGSWRWVTGEPWTFTNWGSCYNQEGELQLHYGCDFFANAWNDILATDSNIGGAVLEYSADCNQDGLVDYGQIRAGELVDVNANNIPDCCEQPVPCTPCLADVDESGAVNSVDLAAVLANWGTDGGKYPRADVNGDGTINSSDLAAVLSEWGPCQ